MEEIILQDLKEAEVHKLIFDNNIIIEWSQKSKDITFKDNEEEDFKVLSEHKDTLVHVAKINKDFFLSISKDNVVKIWNKQGSLYASYTNHKYTIVAIEINYNYILSVSLEEGIKCWDFEGKELYNIEHKLAGLDKIKINSYEINILDNNALYIYSEEDGSLLYKFEGLKNFISSNKILSSGKVLISCDNIITLWDKNQNKIADINVIFNFDEIIEEANHIIVFTDKKEVCILDEDGKLFSSYKPKTKLLKGLQSLIKTGAELEWLKKEKNNIDMYPHIFNPYSEQLDELTQETKKQNIDLKNENQKTFWNYFNRPLLRPILDVLGGEYKEIEDNLSRIEKEVISFNNRIKEIQKKLVSSNKGVILYVAGAIALGLGFISSSISLPVVAMYSLYFAGVVSIGFGYKHSSEQAALKKELEELNSAIKTLEIVEPITKNLNNEISSYRWMLIRQFPEYKKLERKVEEQIENLVNGKIYTEALHYCGLVEDDIIGVDKKPIILQDASLIQENSNHVNKHNLKSFWEGESKLLFASQYVQYIFLSEKKIDVFSTHYDFIQNKFIRKESQAFYYKDVTNISKKEVDRELSIENKIALATEVSLKVSSGDNIAITILNRDTLNEMASKEKIKENESTKQKNIKSLEVELKQAKEKEENEKVEFIELQLEQLQIVEDKQDLQNKMFDKAHKTVQNIRSQIHKYKV